MDKQKTKNKKKKKIYSVCPECKCLIQQGKFALHVFMHKNQKLSQKLHQKKDESIEKDFVTCSKCHQKVKQKNLEKHMRRVHAKNKMKYFRLRKSSDSSESNKSNGECRKMQKWRKLLMREIKHGKIKRRKKVRPELHLDYELTTDDAIEIRKALKDKRWITNKNIAEFLDKNPSKNKIGKFGVPQDKYRWGFYGSQSMEYDIWRKK